MLDEIFFCLLLPACPVVMLMLAILIYRQSNQSKVFRERFDQLRNQLDRQDTQLNRLRRIVADSPSRSAVDSVPREVPQEPTVDTLVDEVAPASTAVPDDLLTDTPQPVRPPFAASVRAEPPPVHSVPSSEMPEELVGPITKRESNRFETAARDILGRVWNWVTVGDEYRSKDVSLEYAIASTWLLRAGVLILVIGIGFFLKYSIDNGWVGPQGRVALSLMFGAGMLVGGIRVLRTRYDLVGQGLMGAGVATLYFGIFAAYNFHHLIDMLPAFALMAGITMTAAIVAVRCNTVLVAVLGIIVGYGTPMLLETSGSDFVGVFSYLLVLGLGVLGISTRRNWHLLNGLSFVCTYAIFFRELDVGNYAPSLQFWQVMPFLSAYFVLFSTMVFLFNVVNRKKSTVLELLALVLNAGIFFVSSYVMVEDAYSKPWVALVTVILAVFYTAHVQYFLLRRLQDRGLLLSFIGLAAFFVAVTIPIRLSPEWLTASWSIQATIMLWISLRMDSRFLRHLSYVLYAIVVYRFGLLDLPRQYGTPLGGERLLRDYLLELMERLVLFGVPIASMGVGFRLYNRSRLEGAVKVDPVNDIGEWVRDQWFMRAAAISGIVMLFVYLHLELNRTLGFIFDPVRLPALTLLWLMLIGLVLYEYTVRPAVSMLWLSVILLIGLVGKMILVDLPSWGLNSHHIAHLIFERKSGYSSLDAGLRLLDFGAIVVFLMLAVAWLRPRQDEASAPDASTVFGSVATGLLFVFLSLETNTFLFYFFPAARVGGISILWTLFALGLVLCGLLKQYRAFRYTGLFLFVVVVLKVFIVDLRALEHIYKIFAFIVLGILVMAASAMYLKFRELFEVKSAGEPSSGDPLPAPNAPLAESPASESPASESPASDADGDATEAGGEDAEQVDRDGADPEAKL